MPILGKSGNLSLSACCFTVLYQDKNILTNDKAYITVKVTEEKDVIYELDSITDQKTIYLSLFV